MKKAFRCFFVCPFLFINIFDAQLAAAQELQVYEYSVHGGVFPVLPTRTLPGGHPQTTFTAHGITFRISYQDVLDGSGFGFDDATEGAARQQRLVDVLTYVADVLNETATVDVYCRPSINNSMSGLLGFAGSYFTGAPGYQNGTAFTRITTGTNLFPGDEEIFIRINFGRPWNSGTGATPMSQFDLTTVLLHEVTHGLGFLSLSTSAGTSAIASNVFSVFDSFTEISNTTRVWTGVFPSLNTGGGVPR